MAVTKQQSKFFENEMSHNQSLYVDKSCNHVNLTVLAESFLDEHNVSKSQEEQVYEGVVDWFKSWRGKVGYNNH